MTDQRNPHQPPDALDELTAELVACGGVLSQIISHMAETAASGASSPDAPPIPTILHELIRGSIAKLGKRHRRDQIRGAARIISQATDAISENIFLVPLDSMNDGAA